MYKITVMNVGVAGASGYAGTELLRLLSQHPTLHVTVATGHSAEGKPVSSLTPSLTGAYGDVTFLETTPDALRGLDVVFLALPHGASQDIVPELIDDGALIVDLGADFRLPPEIYEQWYGEVHRAPDLCHHAANGLVERNRDAISIAKLIASPGCYPTATTLALGPLCDADVIDRSSLIVDAASGVSGAGRPAKDHLTFNHVDENFSAYGLLDHRHTAEMERNLGATVLFTPHLAPMVRGMLVTAYAKITQDISTNEAMDVLHKAYDHEPFIHVVDEAPSTKWATGSNAAFVSVAVDKRTKTLIALAAIDNLGKGAAGQAIQAANVALGLDETAGLSTIGVYP